MPISTFSIGAKTASTYPSRIPLTKIEEGVEENLVYPPLAGLFLERLRNPKPRIP